MSATRTPAKTPKRAVSSSRAKERGVKTEEHMVSTRLALLVCFGLALLRFLPALLPGQQIFGVDYLAAGFHVYDFIAERITSGELPRWIPYIFGGVPVQANPGSTFYPLRVLLDPLLPTARVFPVLLVVHFAVAGIGMYALLRELGVRSWIALVGALAFEFTGITISFVYAGHDGRIIVSTMAPLLFAALHRGIRTGGLAPFAGVAAIVGFALLSFQIQSAYYLLLAAALWSAFLVVRRRMWHTPRVLARTLALGLGAVALAFTMAAVNFLPFQRYVPDSPRPVGGRGYEHATSYSMPIRETLGLAVPEEAGFLDEYKRQREGANEFKLHTEYVGALVLLLLAVGVVVARRDAIWWFFAGLTLFVLSISYGGNTPLYRVYYELLPGTKQFRAPAISFFLAAMSLVAMAGLTLERLASLRQRMQGKASAQQPSDKRALDRVLKVVLGVAAAAVVALLAGGAGALEGSKVGAGVARFSFFLAVFCAALWMWLKHLTTSRVLLPVLAALCVIDLWIVSVPFILTDRPPEELYAPDEIVQFLRANGAGERVWVFPYPLDKRVGYRGNGLFDVNSNYLMRFGIEQAGGEHGNQLQRWNQYVGAGMGRRLLDWHNFVQRPATLNAANVRYVVSAMDMSRVVGMERVFRGTTADIYRNVDALPRAYVVAQARMAPDEGTSMDHIRDPRWDPRTVAVVSGSQDPGLPGGPAPGFATIDTYTPDRVVVRTETTKPGLLVLADNYLQGWTATVDGAPATVYRANHTFRGVRVDQGSHVVEFRFEPPGLRTGFALYLVSMSLLALYGIALLVRRWRGSSAPRPAVPAAAG
jgi:hypothetical protein